MFVKLIKHEWDYMWKRLLLIAACIVVTTVLGCISFSGLMVMDSTNEFSPVGFLGIMGFVLYYGVMIVAAFAIMIISAIRMYKTLFGDEAYIIHTLPVSTRQVYWSKIIIHAVCEFAVSVLILISFNLVFGRLYAFEPEAVTNGFNGSVFGVLAAITGMSAAATTIVFTLLMLLSCVISVLEILACIVLGQYWKKHKIIGAIVSYLVLTFIMQVVSTVAVIPAIMGAGMGAMASPDLFMEEFMRSLLIIVYVITAIIGAASYFIADHGFTKKLNLV